MCTKGAKFPKNRVVAKLVTENRQPCLFCNQDVDDEVIYGKLYSLGDIQCHYFCVLLSCCLVQKGKDTEGLFGFLYKDILAEVERSKKHKCSYCGRGGASLGCAVSACRKQFHVPCGRQKNAVSLFYGNYKSFCELHAPKQKISDTVMANARARMKRDKLIRAGKIPVDNVEDNKQTEGPDDPALLCVICYEPVQAYPTTQTFWPPCCGRDAWLHRTCLQRMALSAGMHYLKCPLCNDKDAFYEAVSDQGYYLPDRDAAWELEQNAFAEIYTRELTCAAEDCECPYGREHDELGIWDIKLCLLCGSWGMHQHCSRGERLVCASCRPAARGIEQLETRVAAVIVAEQAREQRHARSGPVMPSRMSLRRTKGRVPAHSAPSSSQNLPNNDVAHNKTEIQPIKDNPDNHKAPKRPRFVTPNLDTSLLSPIKMLEQGYLEKGGGGEVVVTKEVIEKMKLKFSKPKPLSAKKKIVNEILDDLFKNMFKESLKSKDPVKEWNSPKKAFDLMNACEESTEHSKPTMETDASEIDESNNEETTQTDAQNLGINGSVSEQQSNEADEKCDKEIERDVDIKDAAEENIIKKENEDINLNECETLATEDNENSKSDDGSPTSTFQLPSEFVAESDEELPIFDTPKKLKTVDMKQDSSIEISERGEMVNIDLVQISSGKEKEFIKNLTIKSPVKSKMCSFKFSPVDKETLQNDNIDIDVESFKDHYLNEVDRDKNYNKDNTKNEVNIPVVNVATDTKRKRKAETKERVAKKRKNRLKIKIKSNDPEGRKKRVKKLKKIKELQKFIGRDKRISLKIRLKDASNNKIKKNKKKQKVKCFKQYILKYSPVQSNKVIAKPETEVSPLKRKYTRIDKPVDNLVQTSIQSFFKAK